MHDFNITQAIKDLAAEWLTEDPSLTPRNINAGICAEFSHFVWEASGKNDEVETFWGDELPDLFDECYLPEGHSFVKFKGRYYDAECPEGVDSPTELPFYKRQKMFLKKTSCIPTECMIAYVHENNGEKTMKHEQIHTFDCGETICKHGLVCVLNWTKERKRPDSRTFTPTLKISIVPSDKDAKGVVFCDSFEEHQKTS